MKGYRKVLPNCEPAGAINEQVATVNFLYCHEDNAVGQKTGLQALRHVRLRGRAAGVGPRGLRLAVVRQLRPAADRCAAQSAAPGDVPAPPPGLAVGDPKRITEVLKNWESTGIDCVNFLLNALETVPQAEVLASMRLFAKEVMPHFKQKAAAPKTPVAAE